MSYSAQVSVKQLVTFTCRAGDLYSAVDGRATAEEGIATQKAVQRHESDTYATEISCARTFQYGAIQLRLRGRADGADFGQAPGWLDEIKTSRADPVALLAQRGHLHWAQLRIYGALIMLERPALQHLTLRLRYVHPDSLAEHCSTERADRDALLQFLLRCIVVYCTDLAAEQQRRCARDARLTQLAFPLTAYRPNQRALAARSYQALVAGQSLLLQASTGIGKSLGVLFPAVRALGAGPAQRYFYLTARRTGALAAARALRQLNAAGAPVRWVQLQSKARLCQINGERCVPSQCPNAIGYYDRVDGALAALQAERALDPALLGAVATAHQVCPFELSLDAARWADVIVGDYNYVIDPDVRLQRFADDPEFALLIDEAHQLAPRTLSMLSAHIDQEQLRAARRVVRTGALRRRLDSVQRAMATLRRAATGPLVADSGPLDRALERLCKECATLDWDDELDPAVAEFLWSALRWQKHRSLLETLPSVVLLEEPPATGALRIRNECLDAAPYLARLFDSYAADIRFSATLQPPALYQRQHGRDQAAQVDIASPYAAAQLAVCLVTDVPTYYRARSASMPRLVDVLLAAVAARAGTYLVALPSFDYLQQLDHALQARLADGECDLTVRAQSRGMSDQQQTEFLASLRDHGGAILALVVLGGVFAESVDFTGVTLAGVICVGVGLAPPSTLRTQQQQHFDAQGHNGELLAYTQPAMVKVVQMAGRLLRSPDDRGVLILVDDRFARPVYQQFFPAFWRPQQLSARGLVPALENFWSEP